MACLSSVTRFVWSGDQLLWERKSAEGTAAYVGESSGLVSYTHAGGIDRPLAIWKAEVGTIVTHQNWRGQFARGTFGVDQQRPVQRLGQSSDCPQYPPSNGCIPVPWPGWNTTAWHEGVSTQNTTGYEHYWMGSLATGMRDASGQLYMRNRYYDPQTGQFTQPDPIGLAGGLNSYGFAAGDPVTYSDPYGLSADDCGKGKNQAPCNNPKANGSAPIHELAALSPVNRLSGAIDNAAAETGVDGDLIRAVMYVETTHGWYDEPLAWFDRDASIRPMNVNPAVWSELGHSRADLRDPETNVMAGAQVLGSIINDLPAGASVAQIATRYNAGPNAAMVNDYGARVARVYQTKAWIPRPGREGNSQIPGGWRN